MGVRTDVLACAVQCWCKGFWPSAEAPCTAGAPKMRTAGKQCTSQSHIQPGGGSFWGNVGSAFSEQIVQGRERRGAQAEGEMESWKHDV